MRGRFQTVDWAVWRRVSRFFQGYSKGMGKGITKCVPYSCTLERLGSTERSFANRNHGSAGRREAMMRRKSTGGRAAGGRRRDARLGKAERRKNVRTGTVGLDVSDGVRVWMEKREIPCRGPSAGFVTSADRCDNQWQNDQNSYVACSFTWPVLSVLYGRTLQVIYGTLVSERPIRRTSIHPIRRCD